jgi:hypothetical protein
MTYAGALGQTQVYNNPGMGVEGDWSSKNPVDSYLAGPGGLVAGVNGVLVGTFVWAVPPVDIDNEPTVVNNFGSGNVAGFIHREQQGLLTVYLQYASLLLPAGFPVTVFNGGDFIVRNNGSTYCNVGMKAYANNGTGLASFALTGTPGTGGSGSASTVAAGTSSATISTINGNILTVPSGSTVTGTLYPGTTLSGTGVSSGTQIVSQISGTPGGIGTYYVSITGQTVASTTISGTYGLLTVGGTVVAGFAVGNTISGSGVVAGTTITALGTGAGGAGTYIVNNNTVVSSTAIAVASNNVETKWVAASAGPAGSLIKITSHIGTFG